MTGCERRSNLRFATLNAISAGIPSAALLGVAFLLLCTQSVTSRAASFDLVLHGGRVMDPESGLDGIRNIGIQGDKIAIVTTHELHGQRTLEVGGLVVAPGFIDLHQHDQSAVVGCAKASDGVTTALELEMGRPDVGTFLRAKEGRSLINYGSSASHAAARAQIFGHPMAPQAILPEAGPATDQPMGDSQLQQLKRRLESELAAGALGIGIGIEYTPGASTFEVEEIFRLAAAHGVPVFVHARAHVRTALESSTQSVKELLGDAERTGASLHIVHINSTCLKFALHCLSLIDMARQNGVDVTTEAYPYQAGLTYINSALFNEGWRARLGIDYGDLQVPTTGERLIKARFESLRRSRKPIPIIMFLNSQEAVDRVIENRAVIIASDGEAGHPRNAGTYARVIQRYVSARHALTLMEAISKMTLLPARRLANAAPAVAAKGRIRSGADADLIAFDADRFRDNASYKRPTRHSTGMKYVLVGGTVVIDGGTCVQKIYPGRAVTGEGE